MRDNNARDSLRVKASVKTEEAGPNPAPLLNDSQQWIDAGGNPAVRHEGGTPSNNLIKDVPHRATVFVGPTLKSLLEKRIQLTLFFSQIERSYLYF
jgi:hypothetical protein